MGERGRQLGRQELAGHVFLGIDKTVRLLGSFGLEHSYGYELEGRSYFKNDAQGLIEITNFYGALAKTNRAPPPKKLG